MEKNRYLCDLCDESFSRTRQLFRHITERHVTPKQNLKSKDVCEKSQSTTAETLMKHTGDYPYVCEECRAGFSSPLALKRHSLIHRKQFMCDLCNKSYTTAWKLRYHHYTHTGNYPYVCEQCGSGFPIPSKLKDHRWSCKDKKDELKSHQYRQTGNDSHVGKVGKSIFPTSSQLSLDPVKHNKNNGFVCEICKKSFTQARSLKNHRYKHTRVYPHHCEHCGRGFPSFPRLKVHFKVHRKDFICEVCNKLYSTQTLLKYHQYEHSGKYPCVCKYCGTGFPFLARLKSHELAKHSREKKFICDVCSKSFRFQHTLKYHQYWHTGKYPHVCEHCGKGFPIFCRLKNHLQLKHTMTSLPSNRLDS